MRSFALVALIVIAPLPALAQEREVEGTEQEADPRESDEGERRDPSLADQPQGPEITGVEAPAIDAQHPTPGEPIYAAWWFWTGIGAVVIGITLAIVVDLTTDDPAPSDVRAASLPLFRF